MAKAIGVVILVTLLIAIPLFCTWLHERITKNQKDRYEKDYQ